jgi:hypothetical protein
MAMTEDVLYRPGRKFHLLGEDHQATVCGKQRTALPEYGLVDRAVIEGEADMCERCCRKRLYTENPELRPRVEYADGSTRYERY